MRSSRGERDAIKAYVEWQSPDDAVVHVEKVAVERVAGTVHTVWDVHCRDSRWWVVDNSTNLYSQDDFKSVSVVLTFHVGLMTRLATQREVPVNDVAAGLLPGAWRRWEQAVDALTTAAEAEDFQGIGVRLRECLVSFVGEVANPELVPHGREAPKSADVDGWTELLAETLAAGSSNKALRAYLKAVSEKGWDYVNWLTHYKGATHLDAEIGIAAVEHILATFTATRLRWQLGGGARCASCGSYAMAAGACVRCGWEDPEYQPPEQMELSDEERAARLAEPHVLSSDVDTFVTPEDYRRT